MLRFFCTLLLLTLLPLTAAGDQQQKQLEAVANSLGMHFPSVQVRQIATTPLDGIYEVVTQNNEYLYFAPSSGHIFTGELWNNKGQNLTRLSKARDMTDKLSQFPLDKAIKIGDGPNQVVEVSDPDCPFCRDGSAFFSAREDVTRYIFLFPLERLHPQAAAKSRYILSAEDQEGAYEDVYSGMYDKQPLPDFKDNGLLDVHQQIAREAGINSTPRYWINGKYISGTKLSEFEKLLDRTE